MKKFTSVIFIVLISVGLNAQKISDIGLKLQDMQKKYSEMNRFGKLAQTTFVNPDFKSAAISQKLDSTVNQAYDDESGTWQYDYKDEFLYDQNMRNTVWIGKEWNTETRLWDLDYKTALEYDGSGRMASMLIYDKDTLAQEFVVFSKTDYFYNSGGLPDSVYTYYTEDAGTTWLLTMKVVHHYNASKQLIKTETWNYDEDAEELVMGTKTDFTYTATGKIETSLTTLLLGDMEIQSGKSEYAYDGSDRLTYVENYRLNYMTLLLQKNNRDFYQYNAAGRIAVEINSTWNGASWVDSDKTQNQFNAAGDITVVTYSTWNGASWDDESKDEFEYGTIYFSEVAYPMYVFLYQENEDDLNFTKIINVINSFEMVDGNWIHTDINRYYYSGGSSGTDEFTNAGFKFYPNPASESITFSWGKNSTPLVLKMYQVTGAQVLDQKTWTGKEISVSHLVNGVYFFKLTDGKQTVYSGKIVKR